MLFQPVTSGHASLPKHATVPESECLDLTNEILPRAECLDLLTEVPPRAAVGDFQAGISVAGLAGKGPDTARRKAMRSFHHASSTLAGLAARVSPTLAGVERGNLQYLQEHRQHMLTPQLLADIRDQLLGHIDDAFLTNIARNARKAGDALCRWIAGDDRQLTRTRSQLIAEMLDLRRPDSALNRALESLAPRLLQRVAPAAMQGLERSDMVLKVATETLDQVMQPTRADAERAATLIGELGRRAEREFDAIHLDAMQRIRELAPGLTSEATARLVARMTRQTGRRIAEVRTRVFDEFRRRNCGEFGFNSLSEQVRANCNIEFYKSLLLPSGVWGLGTRVVSAAFSLVPGTPGIVLTVASAAALQYFTAVASQASVGPTGAATLDMRPYDSRVMHKPLVDPEVYWNQRNVSSVLADIGRHALDEYTRPGNPAALKCRRTVHLLEHTKGYDHEVRKSLAPTLYALLPYWDFLQGLEPEPDNPVPPPVRIAALLHAFADELPSLKCASGPTRTTPGDIVHALIEALHRSARRTPPADVATIAERAELHVAQLLEASATDRAALGACMAPDTVAMLSGGLEFTALVRTLMQTVGPTERALFDSKGFLAAQYHGLFINAASGLLVQVAVGVAAVFGIGAATVAGGPAAGLGAGVFFALLAYVAGSISRNFGARAWYSHDRRAQTFGHLYGLTRHAESVPVAGEPQRHRAAIVEAVMSNHVPLYKRRRDQLVASHRAALETALMKASAGLAQQGFAMLHTLEQQDGGRPFAAELAGASMDAMHEAADARKHQAVIATHEAAMHLVSSAAEAARRVLESPMPAVDAAEQAYLEDRRKYGIRQSYDYRARHARMFARDDGSIPAQVDIARLRTHAQACFDRYLQQHRNTDGFHVSRGELACLKTALRTPFADEPTELWLLRQELELARDGLLAEDDLPYHLAVARLPPGRIALLQRRHARSGARVEKNGRAMRILANDTLALQAGRFDLIQDPLGIVAASLESFSQGSQISRHYRVNNDLAFVAFARGTARFAGQVIPVNWQGGVAAAIVLASGGLAIAQVHAHVGDFTLHKLDDHALQELLAHGGQPSALQLRGVVPKYGGLANALASGCLNAMQPVTNPFTFQTSGQMQFLRGGAAAGDPSFGGPILASMADFERFGECVDPWSGEPVDKVALHASLCGNACTTQLKLRIDRRLELPPDMTRLRPEDRARWREARKLSTRGPGTRLGDFLPWRYVNSLTHPRNARFHYNQVRRDLYQLSASLTLAGRDLNAPA